MSLTVFLASDLTAAYRNSLIVVLAGFVAVTGGIWGLVWQQRCRWTASV